MSAPGPLAPYEYEMVWWLIREPLTAGELHECLPFFKRPSSTQATASKLAVLAKRGWIERSPTGIYRATEKARQAVSW